jgi:hypothetical protein
MGNLSRRIEYLETVTAPADALGMFTQAEARKIAEWTGQCAHFYLTFRFARADGTPAFHGNPSADSPWIVYMDACCEALGVELRKPGKDERIEIEPAVIVELLPYLEGFFHVPGNAEWRDRRAWWIRLSEDQIPAEWEYYKSCAPAPNHDPSDLLK